MIHGPNLNLLGMREPGVYGAKTLEQINSRLQELADDFQVALEIAQSNHEGMIVDLIQGAWGRIDGILINPGAYTHTSVAIRDAFLAVSIPFVEVHLSNIHSRESFRKHSFLSDISSGVVFGFGHNSYEIAFRGLVSVVRQHHES